MTDRELRSLNRRELLELLVEQEKESEVLRTELQQAQDELKKKQLNTSDYGMTSESALAMSNIYAQADSAAAMYLETVRQRAADAQAEYDSLIAEAQSKADEIEDERAEEEIQEAEDQIENDQSASELVEAVSAVHESDQFFAETHTHDDTNLCH